MEHLEQPCDGFLALGESLALTVQNHAAINRAAPTRGPTPAGTPGGLTGDVVGALRSLGLVGFVLREDELNDWGELVGVVLVVLAQENNFVVELAGGILWR
jgi:hypothetical protein